MLQITKIKRKWAIHDKFAERLNKKDEDHSTKQLSHLLTKLCVPQSGKLARCTFTII